MRKNAEMFARLEEKAGYHFQDPQLLYLALSHSSYANEKQLPKTACNERLEFLGDAVLELVSSEYLYKTKPQSPEGELTRQRAAMVCEQALAFCADELQLGKYLLLGKGEKTTGGSHRPSVTSDALEAFIGAIYLDGGFDPARAFIHRCILADLKDKQLFSDSKSLFQEMVQAKYGSGFISYQLKSETGPDHHKEFCVQVFVGNTCYGEGKGTTKKSAQQQAAYAGIQKMKEKTE